VKGHGQPHLGFRVWKEGLENEKGQRGRCGRKKGMWGLSGHEKTKHAQRGISEGSRRNETAQISDRKRRTERKREVQKKTNLKRKRQPYGRHGVWRRGLEESGWQVLLRNERGGGPKEKKRTDGRKPLHEDGSETHRGKQDGKVRGRGAKN